MFMFVLAIVLTLVGLGILIFGGHIPKNSYNDDDETFSIRSFSAIPFILAFIFFGLSTLRTVDAGSVGVPVTFGTVGSPIEAGVHLMAPWTGVENVSGRTVEYTMTQTVNEGKVTGDDSVEVKGKDGATGHVDSTTHYHVNKDQASNLYREVGTNYEGVIVRPGIRNCIHNAFGDTNMVDAATIDRTPIQSGIDKCIHNTLEPRGLVVEDFQVRNIRVEDAVQNAINAKVAAQQISEQKQLELAGVRIDAEKSNIEKQAVSDGQQIIKCGYHLVGDGDQQKVVPNVDSDCKNVLTPEYLQYAYIEMLRSISNSPNHDTIVIPSVPANQTKDGTGQPQLQIQVPTK